MFYRTVKTCFFLLVAAGLSAASPTKTVSPLKNLRAVQEMPSPTWDLPDWAQDWVDQSFGDIDWSSPTAWQEWLDNVIGEANFESLGVCPLLESTIGMGQAFGLAANCTCEGNITSTLEIACGFSQCVDVANVVDAVSIARNSDPNALCGNVSLNFTLGGEMGSFDTSMCVDFPDQLYQETCVSYTMSLLPDSDDNVVQQTCAASYGGQACSCTIENLCLNLNCSSILPGAAMDTCQFLQMQTDGDLLSWLPQWDIFSSDFNLTADMVPWMSMDWDNVDWLNFNVTEIDWTSTGDDAADWLSETWSDLVGGVGDGISTGVCTLLESAVQLTEALGAEGSCTCNTTVSEGLAIDCDFAEICVDSSNGAVGAESLCAAVNMTLNFDNLAGIDNEVCMDFFGGTHPTTCFSYTIPFADPNMVPSCSATYGGEQCKCSIDENFCILVDCSEFEEKAVMDTCQIVQVAGAVEAQRFVLPLPVPEKQGETTEQPVPGEEVIEVDPSAGEESTNASSELANTNGGSGATSSLSGREGVAVTFIVLALAFL